MRIIEMANIIKILGVLIFCSSFLSSCASISGNQKKPLLKSIQGTFDEALKLEDKEDDQTIPDEVAHALLPPAMIEFSNNDIKNEEQRFNIAVNNAGAKS